MTRTQRKIAAGQCIGLAAAAGAAVSLSDRQDWSHPGLFALLLCLALLSDSFPLESKTLRISGSFVAIVLAMALMGPAPAALLGFVAVSIDAVRRRVAVERALGNVWTFATFPLIGGYVMERLGYDTVPSGADLDFSIAVFAVFLGTNFVNFLMIVGPLTVLERMSMRTSVLKVYIPVIPAQIAAGLLTAFVAYSYQRLGFAAVGLLTVVSFLFQYLLRTAFQATERGEQLEQRTRELAALQVGLLSTVLKTLSLRDKMTARHSAAVARYAREIAREMGMDERTQDIIHTAGLLHDIGKFVFPDDILLADTRLTDEQYELVKSHPDRGAELVSEIEGYGPVAEIIRAHHERIDGRGYPLGLVGDDIPLAARIIAVCDTYDVMTARDSYRKPVTREVAIAELQRVAGSQLDTEIVAVFTRLMRARNIVFVHTDDADFERELDLEARVRDYAAPRVAAA